MIELSKYKDISEATPEIRNIIYQIELYRLNGNMEVAYELLEKNKAALKPFIVTNESFNKIESDIYNLSVDVIGTQKIILSVSEPSELATNSEWLRPY